MAALTSSDWSVTILREMLNGQGMKGIIAMLEIGNASDTYPANGIALPTAQMGFPNLVHSCKVIGQVQSGYVWSYDLTNEKMIAFQAPAQTHDHDFLIIGGGTIVTDGGLGVDASGDLVKVEAANLTVEGADSASDGGVLSETLAAAALTQPSSVAIAAQDIHVEAYGF